ncbi:MAG: NADP-dependent oxidoreductase [Porticoccus sp.]|nr:NADP-dependent oxidoreductase [Porticoccus sp.]
MTKPSNRQVLLKSPPAGIPQADNFEIVTTSVPELSDKEVLVRNIFLSVEPAMRGWASNVANYAEPVPLGAVMRSFATGLVVASRHPDYQPGDYVMGLFGWQDYAAVKPDDIQRKVSGNHLPLSTSLGVLGLNGMTAYFGLLEVGRPQPNEAIVVSTAAGAVGSCVGQIAKLKGCHTLGITGGPEKVQLCQELFQYDNAIDYKSDQFEQDLAKACPQGIDVYFDNTGGRISDAVLKHLNVGARIVVCGTASIGSWEPVPMGPRVERQILVNRARMQGVLVFDYADRYQEAVTALTQWVGDGLINYREDILQGIEQAPDAIAGLYRGENLGKRLIQIEELIR